MELTELWVLVVDSDFAAGRSSVCIGSERLP